MKKPLYLDGNTVRDASGRVVISALNPCTVEERREIVKAVNAKREHEDFDRDFETMLRFKAGAGIAPLCAWVRELHAEMKRDNDALRERLKQLPEISGRGRPSNGEGKSWCSMRRARRPEDQVSNAERCVTAGETATI